MRQTRSAKAYEGRFATRSAISRAPKSAVSFRQQRMIVPENLALLPKAYPVLLVGNHSSKV